MSSRKKLLVLSPRFLFPANEGGKIRTSNILSKMRGGEFEIVLASPRPPDIEPFAADLASVCDHFVSWPAPAPHSVARLIAMLGSRPVAVAGEQSKRGTEILRLELAKNPDVLLVDFPHAAVLLPSVKLPPSVLFAHNVEAEIFERHAAVANPAWRLIWNIQAKKMRRFEAATLRRFDQVIAVSDRDVAALKRDYKLARVEKVDTGVDLDFHRFAPATMPPANGGTVVFCGAMDWRANSDGVTFLMDEVWPLVLRTRPRARAVIVGRNPPVKLKRAAEQRELAWKFTGYVDDVRSYIADADVYVIPLRVGSGTRIKAYEAMAAGRAVVSTGVGIEGLAVEPETHFLRADTAPEFARAIIRLLDDAALRTRLTTAARAYLEARYSWTHVARQFEALCLSVLDASRSQ